MLWQQLLVCFLGGDTYVEVLGIVFKCQVSENSPLEFLFPFLFFFFNKFIYLFLVVVGLC